MDRTRRLPDAELTGMQAVWDCGAPATRAEIEARLPPERHMAATPLLTLPGQEMAELTVNGQPAGTSFWPPHKFPLAGLLTPGKNTLTLILTGSPANRYGTQPVPYGLER